MTTNHYGRDTNHYVEVDDGSSNPPPRPAPGTVLALKDALTLSPVTGLVDSTGSSVASVSTVNTSGGVAFGCDSPAVLVSADGGATTHLMYSEEALLAAALHGDQSAAVTLAQQAASQAASSAADANTAAASKIDAALLGRADGVAELDGSGRLVTTQIASSVLERLDELEALIEGATTGAYSSGPYRFEWGTDDVPFVAGQDSGGPVMPDAPTQITRVYLETGPLANATQDTTFQLYQLDSPFTGSWVPKYTGTLPKVPAGSTNAFVALPPDPSLTAKCKLKARVVSAAAGPSGSTTATLVGSGTSTLNTATGTTSNAAVPRPTGGASGDVVLIFAATAGSVTWSMPAGYDNLFDVIDPGSAGVSRVRGAAWIADYDDTAATMPITVSSGSNLLAKVYVIRGSSKTAIQAVTKVVGGYQAGASYAGPAGNAPQASDLVLDFAALDVPNPPTNTPGTVAETGRAVTEDTDIVTTRATSRNLGLVTTHAGAIANAAAYAAVTYTETPGTGSIANTSWVAATVFIGPGVGSPGPLAAVCQVDIAS